LPDFESIYERFFPKVYNYIYYRLLNRDRTDDLVSDTFTRVFEKLDTYDESKAKLSTWIFTVARNILTEEFRQHKQMVSLDDAGRAEIPLDYDLQLAYIQSEERRELYSLLARISARERELIAMKFFADMTNRKIAATLGMNESTVSSMVYNALRKLRKGLMENGVSIRNE
jgi:RNA polymerase sigma-70 factor (ECF subfamily)